MGETLVGLEQGKRTNYYFWHGGITICRASDGYFLETFLLSEVFNYLNKKEKWKAFVKSL